MNCVLLLLSFLRSRVGSQFVIFRPISLIRCIYKNLAKVLANCLRGDLSYVLSPEQAAFVDGL